MTETTIPVKRTIKLNLPENPGAVLTATVPLDPDGSTPQIETPPGYTLRSVVRTNAPPEHKGGPMRPSGEAVVTLDRIVVRPANKPRMRRAPTNCKPIERKAAPAQTDSPA